MFKSLKRVLVKLFHPHHANRHRAKVLHPEALLVFSALVLGAVISVYRLAPIYSHFKIMHGYVLGYASNITVDQVVAQTNASRQSAGLAPLTINAALTQAANLKANHMFQNQYWAHTAPSGEQPWDFIARAGYAYRSAGENLARDFGHTSEMVSAWLASPTHRANIMNARYQETGVAVVNGNLQGVDTTLVVQMFGAPRVQAAQITTEAVEIQATPTPTSANPLELSAVESSVTPVLTISPEPAVLAEVAIPSSEIEITHYYEPQDILRSVVASALLLLLLALVYDWYAFRHQQKVRVVGKNLAHILLFVTVLLLILIAKTGRIG